MKSQTISQDIDTESFMFQKAKKGLLEATLFEENEKHRILRVKYKVTFYWK